jgi:hypothetical protein
MHKHEDVVKKGPLGAHGWKVLVQRLGGHALARARLPDNAIFSGNRIDM